MPQTTSGSDRPSLLAFESFAGALTRNESPRPRKHEAAAVMIGGGRLFAKISLVFVVFARRDRVKEGRTVGHTISWQRQPRDEFTACLYGLSVLPNA